MPLGLLETGRSRKKATRQEVTIEFTRKSIHLLIAFVPYLSSLSRPMTIVLLAAGTVLYIVFETLRMRGIPIPLISRLTARAARLRDGDRFIMGPVTLGFGALLSLLVFKPLPASIAIYILAFGDSFSSLVGKTLGRIPMPYTRGKSVEGSLTCFTVSLISAYAMSRKLGASLVIAAVSTIVEAAPTKDWDNILLPLAAGLTATLLGL
ncbi:MAG: phosphatidate cytidylyltransferase [Rectinemataceae bacterium]|nr:phosphatidate cytidylyltransferase [Rectinemataceae bacterium]